MNHMQDILDLAEIERGPNDVKWKQGLAAMVESGIPMNADTATFSAAMKTRFIGPVRDGLAKGKVLLFGDPDSNPEGFRGILPSAEGIQYVGNDFRIPIKAKRNQAVGFRSEGEILPAPGASGYTYLTEPLRYAYGAFNITGQLLKASERDEGSFIRAFKEEMNDLVLSSKLDFNRAAYGDGSGKMADVRTTSTPTTLLDVSTTINFRGGEVFDIVQASTAVAAAAITVTAVDRTNRQLTVTPSIGVALTAGTHFLVRASSDSTTGVPNNSQNREIQGLSSLIAPSGTVHGINPASFPFWKSYYKGSIGAISDAAIRDAADSVGFESGVDAGEQGNFVMITTRGVRRRYGDTLLSVKRFNDAQSVKLHGGFTALMFDEKPIFTDDQCPLGTMYGLSLDDFFWAQMSDWEWMEEDGNVLKWDGTRRDRYLGILFKYCQLGLTRRNSHFKIDGITDEVK